MSDSFTVMTETATRNGFAQKLSGYDRMSAQFKDFIDLIGSKDLPEDIAYDIIIYQAASEVRHSKNNIAHDPITAIRRTMPNIEQNLGVNLTDPQFFRNIRRRIFFDHLPTYEEVMEHYRSKYPAQSSTTGQAEFQKASRT